MKYGISHQGGAWSFSGKNKSGGICTKREAGKRFGISAIILHFISRFALEKNRFSIII